ncbi:hypothetical protein PM082_022074 [Marasmius tenuissimus]|nr:hypothetical protein PM082_022074 [Marasmius tenuissimus]
MVAAASFALLLSGLALSVNAQATPTEPGPGSVFNQGSTCRTSWDGDKDGKWTGMSIQLMTGDNQHMIHLTTVGENLDGNKDGRLEFACPEVDPYSAVYFFQYSAPGQPLTWATRFTIADKDGKSTPPPESTQPDGAKIPWGVGKLVDASAAKPPPSYLGGGGTSSGNSSTPTGGSSGPGGGSLTRTSTSEEEETTSRTTTSNTAANTASNTVVTTPRGTGTLTGAGNTNPTASNSANTSGNTNTTASGANNDNGAVPLGISRPWQATFAVVVAALLFV